MIFRKAAYFYWLSRYLTRALDTIRLVEAYWPLCWDRENGRGEDALIRLRQALRMSLPSPNSGTAGQLFWFLDAEENPLSVRSSLGAARFNARLLREELPEEAWELLSELPADPPGSPDPDLPVAFPRTPSLPWVRGFAAFYEIARTALAQGAASDFLALGQAIEGMGNLAAALHALVQDASAGEAPPPEEQAAVLRGFCSLHAYRSMHGPFYEGESVCRSLLGSRRLPRSFAALLHAAASALERLEKQSVYALSPACDAAFALGAVLASLEKTPKERLSSLLVELPIGCNRLHQRVEQALGQPGGNAG